MLIRTISVDTIALVSRSHEINNNDTMLSEWKYTKANELKFPWENMSLGNPCLLIGFEFQSFLMVEDMKRYLM